jgi:hypothetical protein
VAGLSLSEDNACISNRFRSNLTSNQMSKNEKKPAKPSQKDNARVQDEYTFSNDSADWKQLSDLADKADKKRTVTPKYGNPTKKK